METREAWIWNPMGPRRTRRSWIRARPPGSSRDLMENLPMGVFIVDPVTRLVEEVNQQAADWFGAPKEQIIGRRCHAFVCPAAEHACPVCDLGSRVDRSERVLLRADGTRMAILKSVKRTRVDGREKLCWRCSRT